MVIKAQPFFLRAIGFRRIASSVKLDKYKTDHQTTTTMKPFTTAAFLALASVSAVTAAPAAFEFESTGNVTVVHRTKDEALQLVWHLIRVFIFCNTDAYSGKAPQEGRVRPGHDSRQPPAPLVRRVLGALELPGRELLPPRQHRWQGLLHRQRRECRLQAGRILQCANYGLLLSGTTASPAFATSTMTRSAPT